MNFDIGTIHPNTPHLFADLAELLLIIKYEKREKLHKNDLEEIILSGTISLEEIDDEEREKNNTILSSSEKNSRHDTQLEDVMTQLEYRFGALSDYYPFKVERDEIFWKENINDKHRVYRLLLACSRLRSFSNENGVRQKWAKNFAQLSKIAMCGLLPQYATVRIFDANSDDRRSYYSTDLRKALKILGNDLRVLKINEQECESAGSSGDAGLDIVGSMDFDDGAASNLSIFGQCGAQEIEWPTKTLECSSIRFRNYFQMQIDYPGVMFTPVCFRMANGAWCDNQVSNGVLIADRGRILKLIDLQNKWDEISTLSWLKDFETTLQEIN